MLVGRLIGVNIEVKLELAPVLPPILANANQLQQVIVNLSVNARDAMNGSGRLTITTATVALDDETAARHEVSADQPWVKLTVTDTGCGMDATTKARIFEPFFTTKPAGRGTGLGLATVFGIVKQANGVLEVESELGVGTSFIVYLPMTDQVIETETVADPSAPASVCGGETLLLVEDEDDIRELATMMLEGRGFKVLSAPDAEEALEIAEKHAGEISALITDVVMPKINGLVLRSQSLIPVIPGLRVLFVSGHCRETVAPEALIANAEYLQKPYRSETLDREDRKHCWPAPEKAQSCGAGGRGAGAGA